MARRKKKSVVVLDAYFEPIGRVEFNDAVSDLATGKAFAFAPLKDQFVQGPVREDGTRTVLPWPIFIVLRKYVYVDPAKIKPVDDVLASRMAILHRDNFTCQYCGEDASTIDHIYPQWRGGENTFLNLVAACVGCNSLKGGFTLEEIQAMSDDELLERGFDKPMKLMREPFIPDQDKFSRERKKVWKLLESGEVDLEDLE